MYCQKGETLYVKYAWGEWSTFGNYFFGPEGRGIEPLDWPDNVLKGYRHGSLIGRIGNSSLFYVGKEVLLQTECPGNLFLRINDYRIDDNLGSTAVSIEFK